MKEREYVGLKGMRRARKDLESGAEQFVVYRLALGDVKQDDKVSAYFTPRQVAAAELAERAGLGLQVEIMEWDTMEIEGSKWLVDVPEDFGDKFHAVAWDDNFSGDRLLLSETLTTSTRGPFWQLTRWASDGGPWGHVDLDHVSEAFDTGPVASGVPVTRLRQVTFRDGRVLTREGTTALNPRRGRSKRALMR